jgi:hypothetical protein
VSPEERKRLGIRSFRQFSPDEVREQALAAGLDVPTFAVLEVEIGAAGKGTPQTARGWFSTLDGASELDWECATPWPAGTLCALGAALPHLPDEDQRRLPCLVFGAHVFAVVRAALVTPGSWALAYATWSIVPGGRTAIDPGVRILRHDISAEDQAVADAAVRWLRGLRGAGRKSLRVKPDPSRVEMSRNGWAIRQAQPALGWDKIAARVGAPNGKTLQRWIEEHRLHER